MICSVKSNNPAKYNTVSFTIDIPWKCMYVKYYVSSVNTITNILMSTDEDFIKFNESEIRFKNKFSYSIYSLTQALNVNADIKFKINDSRTFTITPKKNITIEYLTHRAALLTGLYNTKLPITIEANQEYVIQDIPIIQHTKLYLVSLQGSPMYSSIGDKEYTPSIIGSIDGMALDEKPFIYDFELQGKPLKIKTYSESIKYLEVSLVDFMYQPIILKSPLFITLKVKPAKNVDVNELS